MVIRLRGESAATRSHLDRTHENLTRSNQVIANMRDSMSWRVTKPIRSVMSILRGSNGSPDHTY